ncbi:MAG: DUF2339 domain-containing protein [Phycisphaera sp.]|nr:DUF2339 domain-containing protein [Phycisphaera sp.]
MADPDLNARLAAIEARLSALERAAPAPSGDADARGVLPAPASTALPIAPPSAPPIAPPPPPFHPSPRATVAPDAPPDAPPQVAARTQPPPTESAASPANLERFLGGQVAAWIGAVVVIAAIAIFAKLAIDAGWFQKTPPSLKLAMAYLLSAAFAIAGTLLRERIGRLPAASMLAAGVGGLFVSTCAGITPLNVLGPIPALLAGVAAAVAGGVLTLRSRELSVGAISLLGAYIVPVFAGIYTPGSALGEAAATTGALYLTGVYAVALTLAAFGPSGFAWLRFAGVFQAISGFLLLIEIGGTAPALSLATTALWWAMAVAECSFTAMRGRTPRLNTAFTVAATSVAATLALRGAFATNPWADLHSWLPLGMAGVALAAAFSLRSFVPVGGVDERDRAEDPSAAEMAETCARQSMVLFVLAGALVIAQVGVVVRGGALPVTWVAMGAAAILIGRRGEQRATAVLGAASALLGLCAMAVHALISLGGATTIVAYPTDALLRAQSAWSFRFTDTHWTPLLVAFGLLFSARFWSIGSDPKVGVRLMSGFLAACAALVWIGLSLSIAFSFTTVALLLAIPAAALLAGRTVVLVKLVALLGTAIAALGWFGATTLHVVENAGTDFARPEGAAIAAALVVASGLILGRRFRGEPFGELPTAFGFGFGLAALATIILIERLAGQTDGAVTTATIWATSAVAVVATVGAITARQTKLDLSVGLGLIATSLAGAVTLVMIAAEAYQPPEGARWLWHALLSHANLAVVVLLGCGLALRGAFAADRSVRATLAAAAGALFLVGSSTLVYRVFDPRVGAPFATTETIQQSALSVWLAISAVAFVVVGFRRELRQARWTGLALLGLVAAKVLVLDMANAGTLWRVGALLVTGLLFVATSALYSRAARGGGKA